MMFFHFYWFFHDNYYQNKCDWAWIEVGLANILQLYANVEILLSFNIQNGEDYQYICMFGRHINQAMLQNVP